MQTFLPYEDFAASAAALDTRRLNNQRNEAFIILKTLVTGKGWPHHPATKMWAGREMALLDYILAMCDEFAVVRGGLVKVDVAQKAIDLLREGHDGFGAFEVDAYLESAPGHEFLLPSWLGESEFHRSHQSNLIRKDPEFYGPQFPGVPDDIEYVWPSRRAS